MSEPRPPMSQRQMTAGKSFEVLYRADLHYALHSGRGVLFLVFFGVFWAWVYTRLAGGGAQVMTSPEAGVIAGYIFDEEMLRLFRQQSPTMVAFLVVALTATPVFATLVGCDQTASDLASRHLRFLIPRTGRGSIYLARFAGAATLLAVVQVLATLGAVAVAIYADPTPPMEIVTFAARVALTLVVYSWGFVALFAPLTAAVPSPAGVALAGLGSYVLLVTIAATMRSRWPAIDYVLYATPGGFKKFFVEPEFLPALASMAGLVGLSAVYLAAGWRVFRERDA